MTTILRHGQDESAPLKFSIVMVTYARDHLVPKSIAQAAAAAAGTEGVEFILVDNNVDEVDRSRYRHVDVHLPTTATRPRHQGMAGPVVASRRGYSRR